MIGTHMPSQQHVDVKIQRRNSFANHLRQRVAEHALHLAEHIRGTQRRLHSPAAQPAIDELFKIVAQHEIHQKNSIWHLVAIFAHNGSDFSIRQTRIGNRFAISEITGFPGSTGITGIYRITGIPSFRSMRRNNSRRYERTIPVHRIHSLRRVRKRLQIVGFNGKSWRRQQSHKRRTVGMVADYVQQGEHILHFRTFQQDRLSHDQRGQSGLL